MKSYIKIYGPPLLKALDELKKIAYDMPSIPRFYHYILGVIPVGASVAAPPLGKEETLGVGERYETKYKTTVSKSGYTLGEHDFFFEWEKDPTSDQLRTLITKIDNALTPLGCKYTITTK